MSGRPPRILLTSGEPAGIGPDLAIALAAQDWPCELVVAGDPHVLRARISALGSPVRLRTWEGPDPSNTPRESHRAGELACLPVAAPAPVQAGKLDPANARYVLAMLDRAVDGCLSGEFDAMVTAPVHKGVINDAGVPFSGHTEYLADRTGAPTPVMMLIAGRLRIALATTHLPLASVSAAITPEWLERVLRVLDRDLRTRFGLPAPRILVCGLNPHAGESGHLGREELDVIAPVVRRLVAEGMALSGPLPADTAFVPRSLAQADAVLAMFHDQGLPVLKHAGFGHAVNVTLGLPVVRTSVDHGTALELAGTGRAEAGSLAAALSLALDLVRP